MRLLSSANPVSAMSPMTAQANRLAGLPMALALSPGMVDAKYDIIIGWPRGSGRGAVGRGSTAPADPNSDIGRWFKSLKSNNGLPCCHVSDCRRVQARLIDGYYEALIDEHWARVPDDKIRHVENPTGHYIVLLYLLR